MEPDGHCGVDHQALACVFSALCGLRWSYSSSSPWSPDRCFAESSVSLCVCMRVCVCDVMWQALFSSEDQCLSCSSRWSDVYLPVINHTADSVRVRVTVPADREWVCGSKPTQICENLKKWYWSKPTLVHKVKSSRPALWFFHSIKKQQNNVSRFFIF